MEHADRFLRRFYIEKGMFDVWVTPLTFYFLPTAPTINHATNLNLKF